jgi:putative transposase
MRNVLAKTPKKLPGIVLATLKQVFAQASRAEAHAAMKTAMSALEEKVPAVAELVGEAEDDVLSYMAFPEKHWRPIHSTNPLDQSTRATEQRDTPPDRCRRHLPE